MRNLSVSHLTEYQFSETVTLGPHRLLIRPREGHDLRIISTRLDISPENRVRWHRDVYDNNVATVTFVEPADRLTIFSEVSLEHYEDKPLDFVVEEYAVNYPFQYLALEEADLFPYKQYNYTGCEQYLQTWLQGLEFTRSPVQTYVMLDQLNKWIFQNLSYRVREEPGVQTPYETLTLGSGSCRDFATLFLEACRYLGLASRFVSGYLHAPSTETGNGNTHAWAEVYLPGPGWKGFDPTTGELSDRQHIPVAVARFPEWAPPVAGTFYGSSQTPILHVDVMVKLLE